MFQRKGKKTKAPHKKSLNNLTEIQVPVELLLLEKRQETLTHLKEGVDLEEERYQAIAESLVHNVVNHCQSLPDSLNSHYRLSGGLIDYALNRTEVALQLFHNFIVKEGAALTSEQQLWAYALFSASMLKGLGKLQTDYQVDVYDINGQFLKVWSPLLESLTALGSYYSFIYEKNQEESFRCRVNVLIAKLLMPASGFAWIASNQEVLAVWLALINEDWQSAGTLGALLIRADAIAIQKDLLNLQQKVGGAQAGGHRMGTFADGSKDSLLEREQGIGAEFIFWLIQALESGQLMINKAPLFIVPGGMLMTADLFKLFVREHPEFKSWQVVQNGFLSLGLHQMAGEGELISRFEQIGSQQMISGILCADYAVALPERVQAHNLRTGQVSKVSAIELIHQSHNHSDFFAHTSSEKASGLEFLNSEGKWQIGELDAKVVQAERGHRG